MDELGIMINQNGEYISFGKWDSNIDDMHAISFINDAYNTEWFLKLGIPYDENKDFHNQLDVFARFGIIVISNTRNNSNETNEPRLLIASPEHLTEEQINTLNSFKEKLIKFEDGRFSFIDIIGANNDFEIIQSFYSIKDYYNYILCILFYYVNKRLYRMRI